MTTYYIYVYEYDVFRMYRMDTCSCLYIQHACVCCTIVYTYVCVALCVHNALHTYKSYIHYTNLHTHIHIHHIQVGHKNRNDPKKPLSLQDAISVVKEVFIIATERDIYTGDCVEIKVIRKEGVTTEKFNLKHD